MTAHFQPIVSLRQRAIVGLEALARGVSSVPGGPVIGAPALFAEARAEGRLRELEEACHRAAVSRFVEISRSLAGTPLLFLNVGCDPDFTARGGALSAGRGDSGLAGMCRCAGLDPRRVVLEIVECRAADEARLVEYVGRRREEGFLVALDDFGQEHSNLARLASLRPDIVKIDRQLVHGILGDGLRRELVRSLVQMGRRIGALVVAEGVELPDEVVEVSVLGVDLLQGYGIARPDYEPPRDLSASLHESAGLYRERKAEELAAERARLRQGRAILACLREACLSVRPSRMEDVLRREVERAPFVDCAYILDHAGTQRTGTVMRLPEANRSRGNALFTPAEAGSDHSLKEYYLRALHEGESVPVTEPYISAATGRLCMTMAAAFQAPGEATRSVLCLDLLAGKGEWA